MPYRFRLQESLDEGVRRIVREQMERAVAGFEPGQPQASAVHGARRRLKKARTVLRLIRPALGEKAFRKHNGDLREAGLLLAGARDAFVIGETLQSLQIGAPARVKSALAGLARVAPEHETGEAANGAAVAEGVARMQAYLDGVEDLQCADLCIEDVGEGLRRNYAQCREAFEHACDTGEDEDFHDWRKSVQRHWRQLTLLRPGWPDFFDARANLAAKIALILGDDHDLAIVKAYSAGRVGDGVMEAQSALIATFCEGRQALLRGEARALAGTLLAARPKPLAQEVVAYWQAARLKRGLKAGDSLELARAGGDDDADR